MSHCRHFFSLRGGIPYKEIIMFGSIGMGEILLVLLIILLLFGSKELPQMARKVGKGYHEFQKATQNARNEVKRIIDETDPDKPSNYKG